MILCPLMWYGNAREHDMDFGQFCIMFRSIFLEGFARPFAGVRLILRKLVRRFRSLGGELRLRSGVSRIQVENGRAVGVVLDNGEELEARNVLSSAGMVETMRLERRRRCADESHQAGQMSFIEIDFHTRSAAAATGARPDDRLLQRQRTVSLGAAAGRALRPAVGRDLFAQQLPVRRRGDARRCDARSR